jgi:tetratricopeptide (TPR) repeat protein
MIELRHIEKIEDYAENRLTNAERQAFETRLTLEPDIREEFDLYQALASGLKEAGRQTLRNKFRERDMQMKKRRKTRFSLAAAATVVLLIGSWLILAYSDQGHKTLAERFYEKEKGLPVVLGESTDIFSSSMSLFKTGQYQSSLNDLHEIEKKSGATDTTNYFIGVLEYELGNYFHACGRFEKVHRSSAFFDKAQYRLALSLIMRNEAKEALRVVKSALENPDHLFYERLSALRTELEKY